jgi:hypothetical protein
MACAVLARGVPEEALLLEVRSRNTYENLENSLALLRDTSLLPGLSAVILLSCPWHMARVLLLPRHLLPSSIRLLCCLHQEACTESTWTESPDCRRFIQGELRLFARITARGRASPNHFASGLDLPG